MVFLDIVLVRLLVVFTFPSNISHLQILIDCVLMSQVKLNVNT